jgi:hypothetical protein
MSEERKKEVAGEKMGCSCCSLTMKGGSTVKYAIQKISRQRRLQDLELLNSCFVTYVCLCLKRRQVEGLQDMHHNIMICKHSLEVIRVYSDNGRLGSDCRRAMLYYISLKSEDLNNASSRNNGSKWFLPTCNATEFLD